MSELLMLARCGGRGIPSAMRVLRAVLCEDDPRMLPLPADPYWMRRDPCAYCGGPARSWDHIVPISVTHPEYRITGQSRGKQRLALKSNYVRACSRCNGQKSYRSPLVFMAKRHRKNLRRAAWIAAGRPRPLRASPTPNGGAA